MRVVPEPRRGYGSACLAGIAALAAAPPEGVLFLDGDYSDHPEEAGRLLDAIEAGADLAIGSRILGRREPGALLPQARAGNALATFLIRRLYGFRYTDLGPFRAIRWDALRSIGMEDTNFGWTCEMQVKAVRAGLTIVEVPVSYRRRVGVSKIAGTVAGTLRAGYKILFTIARYAMKPHPPAPSPASAKGYGEAAPDREGAKNPHRASRDSAPHSHPSPIREGGAEGPEGVTRNRRASPDGESETKSVP